jgi:DNA-binding NarL/FixJ family response regulator
MAAKKREKDKKKVLIVDDHPVMCHGVAQLVEQEPDLAVCGTAGDAQGALRAAETHQPDVAIVDISLKGGSGIELIKDIKIRSPKVQVLVLSMHDESFYAERVLRAGAKGYVSKGEDPAKLIKGIRKVLDGEIYVSEKVASKMLRRLIGGKPDPDGFLIERLSDREFEVFELIGQGMQTREIAGRLHLSVKTVEAHREHIKAKLKLDTAADVLKYAIRWAQFEKGV